MTGERAVGEGEHAAGEATTCNLREGPSAEQKRRTQGGGLWLTCLIYSLDSGPLSTLIATETTAISALARRCCVKVEDLTDDVQHATWYWDTGWINFPERAFHHTTTSEIGVERARRAQVLRTKMQQPFMTSLPETHTHGVRWVKTTCLKIDCG